MDKIFANNLKKIRIEKGFTQKTMAERIGVATSTYSLYESGKREPNILIIKRIAKVLETSASKLLGINAPENEELKILFSKYQDYKYDRNSIELIDRMLDKLKGEKI